MPTDTQDSYRNLTGHYQVPPPSPKVDDTWEPPHAQTDFWIVDPGTHYNKALVTLSPAWLDRVRPIRIGLMHDPGRTGKGTEALMSGRTNWAQDGCVGMTVDSARDLIAALMHAVSLVEARAEAEA